MKSLYSLIVLTFLLLLSCGSKHDDLVSNGDSGNVVLPEINRDTVSAFPGAQGGGRLATGGRGGRVFKVTSLADDYSAGTLRWAINQVGKRIIVFDVAGTINLTSDLTIKNGDVTIAGQSAPGDGICIAGFPVYVKCNNAIVRFIRFRLGDINKLETDTFGGQGANIIIDHCTASWSEDECVSFYRVKNFTLQWCLISESLNLSAHSKGAHGYGGLWGGVNASFHHNLLAHHNSRNPRFYGTRDGIVEESVDFRYNVIYNWGANSSYGGEGGTYNIVGNYYKPGPATKASAKGRMVEPYGELAPYGKFFVDDNILAGNSSVTNSNQLGVIPYNKQIIAADVCVAQPFLLTPIKHSTAEEAYREVLRHVGVSLSRDEVDTRIIREVSDGVASYGGSYGAGVGIIDSQDVVGGWPLLNAGVVLKDSDGDGIPDEWERKNGLNPNDAADAVMFNLSAAYTNIEVYLNDIVKQKIGFGF